MFGFGLDTHPKCACLAKALQSAARFCGEMSNLARLFQCQRAKSARAARLLVRGMRNWWAGTEAFLNMQVALKNNSAFQKCLCEDNSLAYIFPLSRRRAV